MILQIVKPLRIPDLHLFRILDVECVVSIGYDALDVFIPQIGTHAGTPACPLIRDHSRIKDQIFAGWSDDQLSVANILSSFAFSHQFMKALLGCRCLKPPQAIFICIMKNKRAVIDLDPGMLIASALKDDRINTSPFQIITK